MAMGEGLSLSQDSAAPPAIVEGYASSAGSDLAGRVAHDYQSASGARLFQEQQIFIRALFNSRAFYMPGFNFTSTSSQAFVNATRPKIQTAVALLMPILCPPGQESYSITPDTETVDPEEAYELLKSGMPPDQIRDTLYQKAGKKADRLTSKIKRGSDYTQLNDKLLGFLWNLSLFGTGIMMGPQVIKNPETVVDDDADAMDPVHEGPVGKFVTMITGALAKTVVPGQTQPSISEKIKKLIKLGIMDEHLFQMDEISPLDFYPDPSAMTVEQMRYFIWRMTLGKGQVMEMLDDETFRHDAVKEVLEDYPNGIWQPTYWETAVNALNHQPQQSVPNGRYVCLQWWGYLTAKDLKDAGASEIPEDRFKEKAIVQIWTIGGKVVKVAVSALHTNRLPVYVVPYSIAPNSIWGIGPPEMMFDSQDAINACERSLMDNMGLCSGPQVTVDLEQLADPTSVLEIKPRKIWAIRGKVGMNTNPITFFVPECRLDNILKVQQNEERLSQEQTGLPNFLQGMQGDGVHNRTLGGASLQFNNAVSSLKTVAYNIENRLTIPMVQKFIHFFQSTSNDPTIKGRFMVTAHGVRGLMAKESLIEAMGVLLQNLGNIQGAADHIKWENFLASFMRYSSLNNEDLFYSASEFEQVQQQKMKQAQENQAVSAGIDAVPKLRAEMPVKDAILELVKSSGEGSSLQTAFMKEAAQIWGFMTPDVKAAFESQSQLSHFQEVNQAHELGSNIGDRAHQPIPNVLGDHPHLIPQQVNGGKK